MFELLLKSAGGIEGLVKMLAGAAGLTPQAAQMHIDEIRNSLQNGLQRIGKIENDISNIAAALKPPTQGNDDNGERAPDRPDQPDRSDREPGYCPCCHGPGAGSDGACCARCFAACTHCGAGCAER